MSVGVSRLEGSNPSLSASANLSSSGSLKIEDPYLRIDRVAMVLDSKSKVVARVARGFDSLILRIVVELVERFRHRVVAPGTRVRIPYFTLMEGWPNGKAPGLNPEVFGLAVGVWDRSPRPPLMSRWPRGKASGCNPEWTPVRIRPEIPWRWS